MSTQNDEVGMTSTPNPAKYDDATQATVANRRDWVTLAIRRVQQGLIRMREERGMSQTAVSKALGGVPNQSTISLSEIRLTPTLETLFALQTVFYPDNPTRFWAEIGIIPKEVAALAEKSGKTFTGNTADTTDTVEATEAHGRYATLRIPLHGDGADAWDARRLNVVLMNEEMLQGLAKLTGVPVSNLTEFFNQQAQMHKDAASSAI